MSGTQAQNSSNSVVDGNLLLDQVVSATKQTAKETTRDLVQVFVEQALAGTITYKRNLTESINNRVHEIDQLLSAQLNAIMHAKKFRELEGAWRGLHYLVMNSETGSELKIRVLNVSKAELKKDLTKAVEFDQSALFKNVYDNEFGTSGGHPYGVLIGDYAWTRHPEDVECLRRISNTAAAGFCPFISSAAPELFSMDSWTDLSGVRDLAKIFDTPEYVDWRSFRESEDSRFVTLTLPRVLARLPYGSLTKSIDAFKYEEAPFDKAGNPKPQEHDNYCWMNAAYVMGARMTDAFAQYGFCVRIRGKESGGMVENLPTHVFRSDDGDLDTTCPTEIGITDRREAEFSKLGFLPLCHYKNQNFAVFFGGQTTHKPKRMSSADANDNEQLSARLPYLMATGRFAHYLKIIARDKIGSSMEADACQIWLDRWIKLYVNTSQQAGDVSRAKKPLRDASVRVEPIPGQPGAYNAVAYLRPWIELEELTASMRLVARIPETKS